MASQANTKSKDKVLILFDLCASPPKDHCYDDDLSGEDWKSEAHVFAALTKLGYEPKLFGLYDDLASLTDEIKKGAYSAVFNLSEAFNAERRFEPNIAAFLELLRVRFTGGRPTALRLCKDKALAKKVMAYHSVRVPQFDVVTCGQKGGGAKVPFPAIVKPLKLESSTGIAQSSFVRNIDECRERVEFIHDRLGEDAIIEEYIDGREIYVSVIASGKGKFKMFPPRELFFESVPSDEPRIATFKSKWDDEYRKRWGIRNGPAATLSQTAQDNLKRTCELACGALQLEGYARIDLRLSKDDVPVFIEANSNPSISRDDDFAQSALAAGWSYEELIQKVMDLAY